MGFPEKNHGKAPSFPALCLDLQDTQWPLTAITHTRQVARAILVDEEGMGYFVRVDRDDDFGKARLIETAGGGVEPGETPEEAVCRELGEELGADAEVIAKLGVVSDYYNLIGRHNVNHYFLCRARSFGERHLTGEETHKLCLSTLRLPLRAAEAEYLACEVYPLGRLLAARELPVLRLAMAVLEKEQKKA